MNIRTTAVLFGLLCIGLLTFGLLQWLGVKTPAEKARFSEFLLPSLNDAGESADPLAPPPNPVEGIEKIVVERRLDSQAAPETLEFVRDQSQRRNWTMVRPRAAKIDPVAVGDLVRQVVEARRERKADTAADPARYGLDKPRVSITLTHKDGRVFTVTLGDESPAKQDPVVYALSSEVSKQPMLLAKNSLNRVFAPLGDFRDKNLVGSAFDITTLRLAGAKRPAMEFEKSGMIDWKFKEPKLGDADTDAVQKFGLDLSNLRVEKGEDFIDDGPLDETKLKRYGLGEKEAAYVLTAVRKDPTDAKKTITETIYVGAKDPSVEQKAVRQRGVLLTLGTAVPGLGGTLSAWAADAAREKTPPAANEDMYFARLGDSVFRLSARHLPLLERKPDEFRDRRLVRLDATKLDAVDLRSGGETLRLRRLQLKADASAPSDWELYTDSRAKTKTQPRAVARLIDALNKVDVTDGKGFLDDDARQRAWFGDGVIDLGLDKPQAEITLWAEALERDKDGNLPAGDPKFKEGVQAKPAAKISVGRKDDKRGMVYVRREAAGTAPVVLAIPDPWIHRPAASPHMPNMPDPPAEVHSVTQAAGAGYLGFRDHTLPSFRIDQADKIAFTRRDMTYLAEREEKKDAKGAVTTEWLLKQPATGKSLYAETLLTFLTGIGADTLLNDRAAGPDFETFGLGAKPMFRIVVTTKPDDKKRTAEYAFVIGNKTKEDSRHPNHYYARLETKPVEGAAPESNFFVFLLPSAVVQSLDVELRDTVVYQHEQSAKPTTAVFTWHGEDKDKKPQTTKLELAVGEDKKTWIVKSLTVNGADAKATLPKPDQAKIEKMLGLDASPGIGGPRLNPLYTDRYLVHAGKPDPALRLDPANQAAPPALTVEVQYDNKTARSLVIGGKADLKEMDHPAMAGRTWYAATASSLKDAAFVVAEIDFKDVLAGPTYFQPAAKPGS